MTTDNSHIQNSAEDRFQILSLDDGGIKGLFSAAVIKDVQVNIIK